MWATHATVGTGLEPAGPCCTTARPGHGAPPTKEGGEAGREGRGGGWRQTWLVDSARRISFSGKEEEEDVGHAEVTEVEGWRMEERGRMGSRKVAHETRSNIDLGLDDLLTW